MSDLNGVTNNVPGCLPCPFCGGTEIHIQIFCEGVDHAIGCSRCGAGWTLGDFNFDADAVVAWNTRAESSEIVKLRVIEKLARDFTADYAGDPDDHEYQEECARMFHALKAALDTKPEGEG